MTSPSFITLYLLSGLLLGSFLGLLLLSDHSVELFFLRFLQFCLFGLHGEQLFLLILFDLFLVFENYLLEVIDFIQEIIRDDVQISVLDPVSRELSGDVLRNQHAALLVVTDAVFGVEIALLVLLAKLGVLSTGPVVLAFFLPNVLARLLGSGG